MLRKWWQYLQSQWIERYEQRFSVKPLAQSQHDIRQWFTSELGQRLLTEEKNEVDTLLMDLFGYHLMQLSVLNDVDWSDTSPISHHFSLKPAIINNHSKQSKVIAEFEYLPIDGDSVDVTILHHALDFSVNPHQVLSEAARTIIPPSLIHI